MRHSLPLTNLRRRLRQRLQPLLLYRCPTRSRQRIRSRISLFRIRLLLLSGRCKRLRLARLDCSLLGSRVRGFRKAVGIRERLWKSFVGRGSCAGALEGRDRFCGSTDCSLSASYKASGGFRGVVRYGADSAVCAAYDASGDFGCAACYSSDGFVHTSNSSSDSFLRSSHGTVDLVASWVFLRA